MNENWQNFLISNNLVNDTDKSQTLLQSPPDHGASIFPRIDLGLLSVTGNDARQLLQGQVTCNIDDVTESHAGIGAFCNAKGRVLSTFFIVQQNQELLLILPVALLAALQKRLQMYILRADVQLENKTSDLCLIGMQADSTVNLDLPDQVLQTQVLSDNNLVFKYPVGDHWLWLGTDQQAMAFWQHMTEQKLVQGQTQQSGLLHEIDAGIPWITTETSELFIPQSINLDQLEGINFNKGCYTGQEIVARTHYLGKSKNKMVRAHSEVSTHALPGAKLFNLDSDSKQSIGNIVNVVEVGNRNKMLVVIKQELAQAQNLGLDDLQTTITLKADTETWG